MPHNNSFVQFLYKLMKPPGHPIHLDHILYGRWSSADRETLQHHIRLQKEKLPEEQLHLLERIIAQRRCITDDEIKSIKALQAVIPPDGVFFAPGFSNFVVFLTPVLAGIMALMVLVSTGIRDRGAGSFSISQTADMRKEIIDLKAQLDFSKNKIEELSKDVAALKLLAEKANQALSNNNHPEHRVTNHEYRNISAKIKDIESLIINKPDTVVNLRLLQHAVAENTQQISKKADAEMLREKELRLADAINKDVSGLSREIETLKWVIYLLVIGLTASGGLIVVMRRKQ